MTENAERAPPFEPLRPASRARLLVGVVLGPLLWLVALVVAAWAFNYSSAIALGFLVMVVSFLAALLILTLLRAGRGRQERRYADRG